SYSGFGAGGRGGADGGGKLSWLGYKAGDVGRARKSHSHSRPFPGRFDGPTSRGGDRGSLPQRSHDRPPEAFLPAFARYHAPGAAFVNGDRPVVLITGATGFVGRHVAPVLQLNGWNVRRAVRTSSALGNEVVVGTIGLGTDWRAALDGVDIVLHLAARVHH